MSKGNGKDKDGFQVVDGKPPKPARAKKKGARDLAYEAGAGKRERSGHLPGMEPVTVPKVHQAIEEYVAIRDARIGLTKKEAEAKAKLLRVMKEEGLDTYAIDGHEAEIERGEETVKARLVAEDVEAAEEAELSGGTKRPRAAKSAPRQPEASA